MEFDSDFDLTRPGHPSERRKLTNIIKNNIWKNVTIQKRNRKKEIMNTIEYLFATYCHAILALLFVLLGCGSDGARQSKPSRVTKEPRDPSFTVSQQSRVC